MNSTDVRKRLEQEREKLVEQQEVLTIDFEATQLEPIAISQHSADDATDLFLRDRDQALRRNAEELIFQIDAALDRIDDGTYGICQRCERPIGVERLEARPYVAYCLKCQAMLERDS